MFKIGLSFYKLHAIFREKKKSSVFFANDFSKSTALEGGRCDEESLTEWRGRMVHKAAVWYYEHLGGQKPGIDCVLQQLPQVFVHQGVRNT